MPYTEFLIQPFGPNGLSQLLNYDKTDISITLKAIHCRSAANPGFHEAVAGLASLSSVTSGHLRGVGLVKKDIDPVTNLNDLFHKGRISHI